MQEVSSIIKEKLEKELNEYKQQLLSLSVSEVIEKSYETTIKEEIVEFVNSRKLSDGFQWKLMLKEDTLDYLFKKYMKSDGANLLYEIAELFAGLQFLHSDFATA